jgi:hypothetical protein
LLCRITPQLKAAAPTEHLAEHRPANGKGIFVAVEGDVAPLCQKAPTGRAIGLTKMPILIVNEWRSIFFECKGLQNLEVVTFGSNLQKITTFRIKFFDNLLQGTARNFSTACGNTIS